MFKRIAATLLACTTVICAFVGCGDSGGGGSKKKSGVSDYMDFAEEFCEAMVSQNGGETFYTYLVTSDVKKAMKKEDKREHLFVDNFNENIEETLEHYNIKIKSVSQNTKLSSAQYAAAEAYFAELVAEYELDIEYKVKDGYEIECEMEVIDKENNDTENGTYCFCIVNIDGEGWKVIQQNSESLEYYYGD